MRTALADCEGSVVAEVLPGNLKALSYYKNRGFKIVEEKEGVLEGNEDFRAVGFIMQYEKIG